MSVICLDCRYIGAKPSGIGEVTWALAHHLPKLAPELDFLFLRNPERQSPLVSAPNVTETVVKSPANGPATLWWLPKVVDLANVDLFHAPFNILPAGLTMKTVTTIHDIMWLTNPRWCNPNLYGHIERRFYATGIKRAFDHSNAIATVSSATKRAILSQRPDIARKIKVTLSGVSAEFRKVEIREETLSSIGLKHGQKFILTAGQFAPYKNHEGSIRAFSKAFADREDIDLVMVQRRNAGANELVSLTKQLNLSERVHFTDTVSFTTLLQLYSGALALLHPSFCEGFGNPLAEAMACGCPVITSNQSAMPEVVGNAALLVNPNDTDEIAGALTKVAEDEIIAARMSERGLERAKELCWERFARANLDIYRELLA
ncbi:glycosyltransferase family 1 protein [uncultured Erythrobacter sp.]|uniref:glycosyltransferase family 4 protein n=1 Tax=uncultured Erythrobacter sp. TaxID=263913 RepID=UPI00261848A2|nr:glycosyltransferase family 1 protein [uncultured Erythrobacter sp.]